jgi:hypothetical protein
MKTSFRDRHERLKYLKACETARRIIDDPRLVEQARRFVEDAMAPDPHQQVYTLMWRELLSFPATDIAAALIEDSDRGQLLRETSPVFGKGFTSREVVELLDRGAAVNSGIIDTVRIGALLRTPMPRSAPDLAELQRRLDILRPPANS